MASNRNKHRFTLAVAAAVSKRFEEIRQGEYIPGRPDDTISVITTVEDIQQAAENNGWSITLEQARTILDEKRDDISEAMVTGWDEVIWNVCLDDIEAVGESDDDQ